MARRLRLASFLCLLLAHIFNASTATAAKESCSASDIAYVKSHVKHFVYFCNFYTSRGRVLSPFSGLSKERAYKACECIKESFGTAAKPSLLPSPTGKGFGPNHKCYASDIEVLSKEFTSPTPFCDFYSAWSANNDPVTPMASLNGKRTYNACQCVLKKIPFPSSTKSNPTTSRASPTTTKSTTTKKDPETTTTRPSVKPSSTSHITTSSRSTSTSSGWTRTTITTTIISTTTTTISTTTTTRTTTTTTTTASTTTTTVAPTTTSTSACPDAPTTIAQSIKPFRKRGGVPDITMNYTLTSSGFNSVLSGGSTSTTTTFNNTQIALTDLVTSCVGFGEQYQDFRTDEWQVNLYYQDVVDPYWSCALVSFDAQPPASYVKAVDPTIGCSYDYYGTTNFGD